MSKYEVEAVRLIESGETIIAERAPDMDRTFGNPIHAVEYMDEMNAEGEEVFGWTIREVVG